MIELRRFRELGLMARSPHQHLPLRKVPEISQAGGHRIIESNDRIFPKGNLFFDLITPSSLSINQNNCGSDYLMLLNTSAEYHLKISGKMNLFLT